MNGLGTIARELADQWAVRAGYTWSYPGYVWPGAADTWYYKIKRGLTEWLDPSKATGAPGTAASPIPRRSCSRR